MQTPPANVDPNANKQHWNPKFLLGMLLGGTTAGAGVGLLTNLLNQRRAIVEDQEDREDESLQVPLLRKQAGIMDSIRDAVRGAPEFLLSAPGRAANAVLKDDTVPQGSDRLGVWDYMGGVAAPIGFLGGLQAVRSMHNMLRRTDLREQFEQEENELERLLRQEASKQAAQPGTLSTADITMMGLLGLIPLTGITSAMLTNSYLNQTVPTNKVSPGPKPLRLAAPRQADEEENLKAAKALWLWSTTQLTKSADSGIKGLCGAAIHGALPEIETTCLQHSAEQALELSDKYASVFDTEPSMAIKMASVLAVLDSAMGPCAEALAAGEFSNSCQHLVKTASAHAAKRERLLEISAGFWKLAAQAALQAAQVPSDAKATRWAAIRSLDDIDSNEESSEFSNATAEAGTTDTDPIDQIMTSPTTGLPA